MTPVRVRPTSPKRAAWPLAAGAVLLLLPGCGYSAKPLVREGAKTIAIPIFDNTTVRRGHEFDLTNAVARMVQARTPYRIASADKADLILKGSIVGYHTPALVDDRRDATIVSSVDITLQITLTDRSGKVLYQGANSRAAEFATRRGESEDSARAKVIEFLARWVVTTLEERW